MKVNTDELLRQAEQFQPVMNAIAEVQETIQHIAGSLDEESGTRQLCPVLENTAQRLAEQLQDIAKLRKALNQIAECYAAAENRITDQATGDSIWFPPLPTGMIDLPFQIQAMRLDADGPAGGVGTLDWIPWDPE